MKDLALDDRPREKLWRHGAAALGDNELVALVLGSGRPQRGALDLANELLRERGGLHGLARSACEDLATAAGVGRAKAAQVMAAVELGRRTLTHAPRARVRIATPQDAAAYLLPAYGSRPVEQFGIVLLDSKHRVLKTSIIAVGTLNATVIEPRDVYREAVLGSAAAVIAFHNHPSGDPTPSAEDGELTRRLAAGGDLMGVDFVDHLVLGDVRYFSFRETGRL